MTNVPIENTGIGGVTKSFEDELLIAKNGFENFDWVYSDKIYPVNHTSKTGPYIFEIRADPYHFKDLRTLRVCGKVRIRFGNTSPNTSNKYIASTINNYIHSQFSNIEYSLQGVEFSDSTRGSYPYIAYLQTLLSYNIGAKKQSCKLAGWIKDTAEEFDEVDKNEKTDTSSKKCTNDGYKERAELFCNDDYFDFRVKLLIDLCNIDQYLIPGISIRIILTKATDEFSLLSSDTSNTLTSDLQNLHITIDNLRPTNEYLQKFNTLLSKSDAKYIFDKNILRFYTYSPGISDLSTYNVISSTHIPSMIFVGIVEDEAVSGDLKKNPFNFKHANVRECYLQINGVNLPLIPTPLDIANKQTNMMYSQFLEAVGILDKNTDIGLTKKDWLGGNFILAFDLNPDKCGNFHYHTAKSGILNLILKLDSPLLSSHKVIIFGSSRDYFIIDSNLNIIYNKALI